MPDFAQLLKAASILSGATKTATPTNDIREVLARRLAEARKVLKNESSSSTSVSNTERETAVFALSILEQVQAVLDYDESKLIGSRDLAQLRTLLSIIFKWYIQPESEALCELMTSKRREALEAADLQNLLSGVSRLWLFVFRSESSSPNTASASTSTHAETRTHITQTLLSRHLADLLRPSLLLISANQQAQNATGESAAVQAIQLNLNRLLELLPASQTISSLGIIMTLRPGSPRLPDTTRSMCSHMLGTQLVRGDGVSGLLSATLGDQDEVPLTKLEHVSRLLMTPTQGTEMHRYIGVIVPQLLEILAPVPSSDSRYITHTRPHSHRHAVAFTISRMMSRKATSGVSTPLLRRVLCEPFLRSIPGGAETTKSNTRSVSQTILLLSVLLGNADPSPMMIHLLLSPIVVPLYALVQYLEERPGAVLDQVNIRELVRGIVSTWTRVVALQDAVEGWWDIITGKGGWGPDDAHGENASNEWSVSEGELFIVRRRPPPLSFPYTDRNRDGFDLGLRPDPARLVLTLKQLNKKEISGALFIRCLNEYSALNTSDSKSPLRSMIILNVILEMIEKLGSSILENVQHVLSFIAHALEPTATSHFEALKDRATRSSTPGLEGLRIVDNDDDYGNDAHSPDSLESGDPVAQDLAFTAVNLLLAVLEGHESITPINTPLLQVIYSRLEPLTNDHRDFIRKAALEARLVITAREVAGLSPPSLSCNPARRSDQEVYQEALKLIQDPILPVRAHGLLMLRQLVVRPRPAASPSISANGRSEGSRSPLSSEQSDVDPALIPAIIDVFLQSIQDDDSFVFLNAVQGLSAMVDRLGRSVLARLMGVYAGTNLAFQSPMSKSELDKRLRVGEALGQVVRRCGDALPAYVGGMAPQLLHVFRARYAPTNLRSSALSILAACTEVSPVALLPWSKELISSMIDVLQVESVPFTSLATAEERRLRPPETETEELSAPSAAAPATEDESAGTNALRSNANRHRAEDAVPALTMSAKAPILRRSALHLLTLFLRTFVLQTYDARGTSLAPSSILPRPLLPLAPEFVNVNGSGGSGRGVIAETLDDGVMRSLGIVVRYVRDTDVDGIARAQASECIELLQQLTEARLGLGG